MLQQGDVLIQTHNIPAEAQKFNSTILAEGEATGHVHEVKGKDFELLKQGQELFLRIQSGDCSVLHAEHNEVLIPPGEYKVGIVQEYDHLKEEARAVRD